MRDLLDELTMNRDERTVIEVADAYRPAVWLLFVSLIGMALYRQLWAGEWSAIPFVLLLIGGSVLYMWRRGLFSAEDELLRRQAASAYSYVFVVALFATQFYGNLQPRWGIEGGQMFWIIVTLPAALFGLTRVVMRRIHPIGAFIVVLIVMVAIAVVMPYIVQFTRGS